MFPILQLGPFAIQAPGLFLIASLLLGMSLTDREARRLGLDAEALSSMMFYGLLAGILGARLGYVLRYWQTYLTDPRGIIAINTNTLDPVAGLVVGVGVAILIGWRKRLDWRLTLDALMPTFGILAIGLGFSHLASGNAYGAPSDLPWAIDLWDASRHPSQIYEIIAASVIFAIVWFTRKRSLFAGFSFLAWLALTAGARLFLDAFRGDSVLVADSIRQAQLLALVVLLFSLWLMRRWGADLPEAST